MYHYYYKLILELSYYTAIIYIFETKFSLEKLKCNVQVNACSKHMLFNIGRFLVLIINVFEALFYYSYYYYYFLYDLHKNTLL